MNAEVGGDFVGGARSLEDFQNGAGFEFRAVAATLCLPFSLLLQRKYDTDNLLNTLSSFMGTL